ncbi:MULTISPECIES: LysE family translocator [Paenibacillus]|jgi:RhtB (resistance to homoserine/threonine) family protein|uniref:Lysine exporter protein (LYSE/YGGA) n=2 Tax=Paenibacillus lactis TaxID=228574 RepID=G4HIB5_9BACL|nr:LysE family translocator [Paenibacillus lactis]EHB63088.1 Lysine exporter protein (LYSE/YGGA) [Paenibacillus lactis 154]MBP1894817.1 RhtB (resistance to homoserine/threonine) family protein [Paenibacillus lactis]MCM3495893.1 LysE family translocator [Paenibacillus lactis]GIO92754.1 lysine transporter LysE [Paenibacillus lactis]HAG00278.1 LysE family translocator [Paenibacillus lactis]
MNDILTFLVLIIFLIMSPGVDFALITKRTLSDGRKEGLKIALGISSGVLVHTTAAALGLSLILMKSALAFEVIKYVGAIYLIYIGVSSLVSRKQAQTHAQPVASKQSAFMQGLITNTLNPKVAIFFLTFLPQFVSPDYNSSMQFAMMGLCYVVLSMVWFTAIVLMLSYIRQWLMSPRIQSLIDKATGVVLIGFGLNMIFRVQRTGQ